MILADSSAWIEFDRETGSALARRMQDLVGGLELASTEPVLMQVLAGVRSEREVAGLERVLRSHVILPLDPSADFLTSAGFYRTCRRAGITPRGLIDCLITAVAWRTGSRILTGDRDLVQVGEIVGVPVERL